MGSSVSSGVYRTEDKDDEGARNGLPCKEYHNGVRSVPRLPWVPLGSYLRDSSEERLGAEDEGNEQSGLVASGGFSFLDSGSTVNFPLTDGENKTSHRSPSPWSGSSLTRSSSSFVLVFTGPETSFSQKVSVNRVSLGLQQVWFWTCTYK